MEIRLTSAQIEGEVELRLSLAISSPIKTVVTVLTSSYDESVILQPDCHHKYSTVGGPVFSSRSVLNHARGLQYK